ncbi:hypothetical protein KO528_09685 [Saccharophagus degradans]|uniref:hypothetical protein n=1 Tax=Saccharophagus degradans TaxID=86304 RepID=UPI001C08B802|nr:hypothetical protein [Saccharophagus degradans]MBU2985619.1 hypothetical protein [Saccharophagus degradans]
MALSSIRAQQAKVTKLASGYLVSISIPIAILSSVPAFSLPMSNDRFEVESTVQANSGWLYDDGEVTAKTNLAGLKLKMKHGGKVNVVFNGYAQKTDLTESDVHLNTDYTVNQLYVSYRVGTAFKLSAGRQRVLWGHGLSFIPTDFVNPPLDPSRLDLTNAKGVDAISLDYFARNNSLTMLTNISDSMERAGAGIKWTNNALDGLDFNFVYYNSHETQNAIGSSISTDPISWFRDDSKGELNTILSVGLKQKSEYKPIVTTKESYLGEPLDCSYFDDSLKDNGPYVSAMFGLTYEWIDSRMTFRTESYYLEEGFNRNELKRFYGSSRNGCALATNIINNISSLVPGRVQNKYSTFSIGQDPLTEGTGNRFTDNLSYSIGYTRGNGDGSDLTTLALRSRYFRSAELALDIFLPRGDGYTEFGALPMDRQVTLGVSISF